MNTLICAKCKQSKSVNEFHINKNHKTGYQRNCKKCNSETTSYYYRKNNYYLAYAERAKKKNIEITEALNIIKGEIGCSFCKEKEPICLDFHHVNHKDKISTISELRAEKRINEIVVEINKCIVVCANCHRKIHKGLLNTDDKKVCKITENNLRELVPTRIRAKMSDEERKLRRKQKDTTGKCCDCSNSCWKTSKRCVSCENKRRSNLKSKL